MSHLFVTDLENEIDLVESYIQEYLRPAGLNQAVEDILSEVLSGSGKKEQQIFQWIVEKLRLRAIMI